MRIGVMSDSHGDIYAVKRAVKLMGNVDLIIHLGDYCRDAEKVSKELRRDIIYVRGNCDFGSNVESERLIEAGGKKLLLTHGHNYGVKSSSMNIYYRAVEVHADIVLFGHTHFAEVSDEGNVLLINPGSLSQPRGGAETYCILTIDSGFAVPSIMELY